MGGKERNDMGMMRCAGKLALLLLAACWLLCGCVGAPPPEIEKKEVPVTSETCEGEQMGQMDGPDQTYAVNPEGMTLESRFPAPDGYARTEPVSYTHLMAFSTVWGFGNVINGFSEYGGLKAIVSWVLIFAIYFVPYALMVLSLIHI